MVTFIELLNIPESKYILAARDFQQGVATIFNPFNQRFSFEGVESDPIPPHGTPWQAEGLHSLLKGSIGGSCHISLDTLVQLR